jgi:hypothetical protein
MFKERRTRPKQISADLLRFVLNGKLRKPRGKLKLKVSIYTLFPSAITGPDSDIFDSVLLAKVEEAEAKKKAQLAKRAT